MKKPHTIAFTTLIVITTGLLIGLIEANIGCHVKPKVEIDTYPYAPFNIVHSEILRG
jgi:hypothetical protein